MSRSNTGHSSLMTHHSHNLGHHEHQHAHGPGIGQDHLHKETQSRPDPTITLLQASALLRVVGAIGLLLPLWAAVYWIIS